ncbi:MAG: glycosyltransferase [Turicibacter sp.]
MAFLEDLSTRVIAYSPNKNSKKIAWVHLDLMADNSVANMFRSEDEQNNCYYKFDEIICVSESAKKGFIDKFGIEENVKVIYNPLDEKVIIKKSLEKIFDQDLNEKFRIVTIGRLLPQKGYDQLLIIHKQLISEGYDYELLILGDGPLKDQYNSFIVENNLTDSVHFMGFKENPYKYLKSGDLFVCSSRNEGFSLVVAEALILGVPIISTNCTGPNELLYFGKYGMLVENNTQSLYEGMKELLSNTITYTHYKKQAQERGTFFNLKKSMEQIESLFTNLIFKCNVVENNSLAARLDGKIKVTVFTPTFNRAYRLDKLYNSLREQTCFDFEWLVIDDGSTDDTSQLFDEWINDENKFGITYLKVKNGGKHRAINKGTELAKGKLFFIVDSDDYLVGNAIERVIYWESTIENKNNFAGVSGNRGYSNNEIIGQTFVGEYIDGTSLEREQLNITGDKAEVFYTHVLQNYKFPEIEGENFITENVVWNHIAYDGYKIRWFNEITYITEYLDDGLTKNAYSIALKNPKGYQLSNRMNKKFYESISNSGRGEECGNLFY